MNILAYCDRHYEQVTRKLFERYATDGMMLTCPPVTAREFQPEWLRGHDVIYLDLHGVPDEPRLWGDEGEYALGIEHIRNVDGAAVFATTCYWPETPFPRAFYDAGAKVVIGGPGRNWGSEGWWPWPVGAQRLAMWFMEYLQTASPDEALEMAKRRLARGWCQRLLHWKATQDALEFTIQER